MEFLIYIILLAIVIAIGFILSRPFIGSDGAQDPPTHGVTQRDQYQQLLLEIKAIQQDCQDGRIAQEACVTQIDEKKKRAADLLRMIDPSFDDAVGRNRTTLATDVPKEQSGGEQPPHGTAFCPQCGDRVQAGDKFCMYCGHRLQP